MSGINVLRKLFEKTGNCIQLPIDIGVYGVNLRQTYWLNYFSRAESIPKAIEITWKFVVFIALYLVLRFARNSAYHYAHTIDTYDYLCYRYFGYQCSMKAPREGLKMGGYALYLK